MAILSPKLAFQTVGKIAQIIEGGRPLFERLKGRKPLSYGFLPFVTFAYTHFKMVEARGIEPLSESPFMQLSTSVFYLLRFP